MAVYMHYKKNTSPLKSYATPWGTVDPTLRNAVLYYDLLPIQNNKYQG
jgi:hypothetical protein